MRNKTVKKSLSVTLMATMAVSLLAGCGGKDKDTSSGSDDTKFGWWIYSTDGLGEYYEDYDDNPIAQYVQAQYWDSEKGGIGTEDSGKQLDFSYVVPITGSEQDNFNTMISTGEYPEIVDLAVASDSAQTLYENGIAMDITEYVEKYMPNYLAYLDENPELKPLVQVKEDDGSVHYYAIYALMEGVEAPWQGVCYRRDWVVKYAQPTEYVWDWESDYVKENGHPAVTPLSKAQAENNLEGWKKSDVKAFEANYAANNEIGYEDNVIFPSGTSDPLTISDWEWMFEAFAKALDERGWGEDSNAYCTTVYYQGFLQAGDLVSSFGGGTGQYYIKDGTVCFDGDSDNFKTYLECLNTWYEKGWLDSEFNTRANDPFFKLNAAGVQQGKVGLWDGGISDIGTSVRATCQNAEDAQDAFIMGAPLPINDVYGKEAQMYKEPDALYQTSRKGTATIITEKAEGKDLATLFTYLDWTYTFEGAMVMRNGLNEEQYASVKLNPDLYAENDVKTSYVESTDEDGRTVYTRTVDVSDPLVNALIGQRMDVGLKPVQGEDYRVDNGAPAINQAAYAVWTKYLNTGSVLDYTGLMNGDESDAYNKVTTAVMDYQKQYVPGVIKGTMSWEDYVAGVQKLDPDSVTKYLQKYVDLANSAK